MSKEEKKEDNQNVNDILQGGNIVDPNESKIKDITPMNPIVQERLERESGTGFEQTKINHEDVPENQYVTKAEIIKLVSDLNAQFKGITSWLNEIISKDKTYKSVIMNMQASISNMNSRLAALERHSFNPDVDVQSPFEN